MSWKTARYLVVLLALIVLPMVARAQEATLTGVVTDDSGGLVPGVKVTATLVATGNTFLATTDTNGVYRIPVRIGIYSIKYELTGFATTIQSGVEVLVGQVATLDVHLKPASVEQTVQVTTEAPLIETTQSALTSDVDPLQVQDLPVNGRNWVDMTMLTPGSHSNYVIESPVERNTPTGTFQLNMDGQQITQLIAYDFGQPRYSKDAIEEFQVEANQFPVTEGRSTEMEVNAVTKSGTNQYHGTVSGFFRDSTLGSSPDFVAHYVLPYDDKQFVGTFGGPIVKDKIHFFLDYEHEIEDVDYTYNSLTYPAFNIPLIGTRPERKAIAKVDFQLSPTTTLTVRFNNYDNQLPFDPRVCGNTSSVSPAGCEKVERNAQDLAVHLTRVYGNKINEIKFGWEDMFWFRNCISGFAGSVGPSGQPVSNSVFSTPKGPGCGPETVQLVGYTIGESNLPAVNHPQEYSLRDDFTFSFSKWGEHTIRTGGEVMFDPFDVFIAFNAFGVLAANNGTPPAATVLAAFPNQFDETTWNLSALSPYAKTYSVSLAPNNNYDQKTFRHDYATWVGDDWKIRRNLTLNLGLRYDVQLNALAQEVTNLPFMTGHTPNQLHNFAPRFGFAWALNDKTVIRGGWGKYFADLSGNLWAYANNYANQFTIQISNPGAVINPNFASNPFNGAPVPTYAQALANSCATTATVAMPAGATGCYRQALTGLVSPNTQIPFAYQTSIGVQRQIGNDMSFQLDYIYQQSRHEIGSENINLLYNSATGVNTSYLVATPWPQYGTISMTFTDGYANRHSLEASFHKRFNKRWEVSGTYTLSYLDDAGQPTYALQPGNPIPQRVPFALQPDLQQAYGPAVTDQRHRVVVNGIYDLPYGFELTGLLFYGSGERFNTAYGGDPRNVGTGGQNRFNAVSGITPRNNFVGLPLLRVDSRLNKHWKLPNESRFGLDTFVEVYNLFNHANYGSYNTTVANANYGIATSNSNIAFSARSIQLGFRFAF